MWDKLVQLWLLAVRVWRWLRHPLATRTACTPEGSATVALAHRYAWTYPDLSEAELIRLAYWGVSGDPLSRTPTEDAAGAPPR